MARPFARREVAVVAAVLGVLLVALAPRYGYHRDELYFLEAGRHLAWGYPDQPPMVPLLARLADTLTPGSLLALRMPSALAAVSVVVLTALIARELGASRGGQTFAAATAAICGLVLAMGHLLSTATFGLLGWTALTLLLVRILRQGATWPRWLGVGVVAGVTAQANPLVAVLLLVFVVALAAVSLFGPGNARDLLRDPGLYLSGLVALVIVAPYLFWQASHGWPQLEVASGISAGESGSSEPRSMFVPMQFLLVGPGLTPIWLTGLVRLLRAQALRVLGVTYLAMAVLLLILGGKPYYLAGLYPLLLAAGAQPVLDRIGPRFSGLIVVLSLPALVFTLPVLPVARADISVAVNYDIGETIGWPELVDQVARAYRGLPEGTVILTRNYGEAGAIDRYGAARGLPAAYSGHMGYYPWGPPPESADSVLAIGIDRPLLERNFRSCREVGELSNRWDIDNDENGTVMFACTGLRSSWAQAWPSFRRP